MINLKKIIIDPGHGGKDPGGGTNQYWKEKDMVLKISLLMEERLKALGFDVSMTRRTDEYLAPVNRASRVKNSRTAICISNHINNTWSSKAEGAETIHSIYSNGVLANKIIDELVSVGAYKRRVFSKTLPNNSNKDYYYMHRWTGNVETIIVEYGFASNSEDTMKIMNDWKEYVEAVVKAMCNYCGVKYEGPEEDKYSSWAINAYTWAKSNGITDGLRPKDVATREEVVTMFYNFENYLEEEFKNEK